MSTNRPDIELALDVRSYERVFVLTGPDSEHGYSESWTQLQSRDDLSAIDSDCVVVVDRIDVSARSIAGIGSRRPRLLAFAPRGVEQEKLMRRMLASAYPWSEVWTVSSSFGKLLVTRDARGDAYNRENVRDERPVGIA